TRALRTTPQPLECFNACEPSGSAQEGISTSEITSKRRVRRLHHLPLVPSPTTRKRPTALPSGPTPRNFQVLSNMNLLQARKLGGRPGLDRMKSGLRPAAV